MMAEGKFDADIVRLHEANPFLSNTDLVYTILRDQIVNHKLQPGKKLNQEQIAIDMNVSRTPVREAFFRLETEGPPALPIRTASRRRSRPSSSQSAC